MSESIKKRLEEVLTAAGACGCVECGKCVAVCPMVEMYADFGWEMSPRGMIRRALTDDADALLQDPAIWYCTGCNAGTRVCPEGVSCRDLIQGLRQLAIEAGMASRIRNCVICGAPFASLPVDDFVRKRLNGKTGNYLETCSACRQRRYAQRNA
ncbi:4Fe-4S dicluster domain-containing protein [uncultured Desulfosarcina sp.]|uniref:4Fe-4S dicluster domain-containing protein n=1 Tax=uncultured Desulfosarcina sp. TaxID=218289 RepID=UPI0029C67B6C|nr:4Fe-4S dicluster domain-containing protein [uncultured Desulfosarcina sp.]